MVERQLIRRDITNEAVLHAMGHVPRHRFVPDVRLETAYADHPIPIGHGQTISQPYIVALMTQLVQPQPEFRALDVGTGCGYQAAVLATLVKEVCTMEIVRELAEAARQRFQELHFDNVETRCGDAWNGWVDRAPFDVIICAAAPEVVPPALIEQLKPGGRLVLPVGSGGQQLVLIQKSGESEISRSVIAPVSFVRMTGRAESERD